MNTYIDTIVCLIPLVVLIYLMTKRSPVPSHKALPFTALFLYFIKLTYFNSDPNITNATILNGLLTAWKPILIIWGAVFLFKTMEHSGGMDVIRTWLNGISKNSVAQLMIIGWAFSFLIEGASGFGTPAALAAPILVGLGFKPVRVAILCLIMNSVPVSFGAVGTPTWFGFSQIGLSPEQIIEVGFKSAIVHSVAALLIPPLALLFVVSKKELKENILFVYLSILSCIIPYLLLARVNCEFPSILGGMIGLCITIFLSKKGIGLARQENQTKQINTIKPRQLIKALFPLWATIIVLLITRIRQIGIKDLLVSTSPSFDISLGSLGDFSISSALVVSLKNIFGTTSNWSHQILYLPSIIPFVLTSGLAFLLYRSKKQVIKDVWNETNKRMANPVMALLGALVFVKLLMSSGGGDSRACTMIIGDTFASALGEKWQYFASYLGAVGAFFAGSNTVSNLTFGGIQYAISHTLDLNTTTILALQSVGGGMGNMVCINNIVAVCSILGIQNKEGFILKRTVIPMIIYGLIAAAVGFFL